MSQDVFDGYADIPIATLACGWSFAALALLSIFALIWRASILRDPESPLFLIFGVVDYLVLIAFLISIALVALTTWSVIDEGQGKHDASLPRPQIEKVARSLFANELLWTVINTLVRLSGLILLCRLFCSSKQPLIRTWFTLLIITALTHGAANVLASTLICHPLTASWDSSVVGKCGNQILMYLVFEVVAVLLDIAILISPIPLTWRLKMSPARKLGVLLTLSAGSIVVIITGLRIQALRFVNASDISYSSGYIGLLSELGGLLGVIACCIPSIVILFRRIKLRWPSSSKNGKTAVNVGNPEIHVDCYDEVFLRNSLERPYKSTWNMELG